MNKQALYILGLIAGIFLLSSFTKTKNKSVVLSDLFSDGDPEVYSKIGTKVYDNNGKVLYTYDTAGVGMKIAYTYDNQYFVIYNYTNENDPSTYSYGYVNFNDVQTK